MKRTLILLALLALSAGLRAQEKDVTKKSTSADSLMNAMSTDDKSGPVVIFKSSRMILSQSTETVKKNNLNFLVIHRFGDFAGDNGGGKTYFGLDDVSDVYIGFEYGVSDNLNIDIGRTTIGGLADLELKYAVVRQSRDGSSPFAITLLCEAGVAPYGSYAAFSDRTAYLGQVMIARKFSPWLSLQITPTFVRDYTSPLLYPGNQQQFFALTAMARLKLTNHMGFIIDYGHPFSSSRTTANGFYDPLGFGIEIETGGHVFTINVTNSRAVSEINYLSDTQSNYSKGQFRVGFTISRMFDFNHKEKSK